MNRTVRSITTPVMFCIALLSGFATTEPRLDLSGRYILSEEQRASTPSDVANAESLEREESTEDVQGDTMRIIDPPYRKAFETTAGGTLLSERFSNQHAVSLSSDALPLDLFLHHALGEILSLNYMLD